MDLAARPAPDALAPEDAVASSRAALRAVAPAGTSVTTGPGPGPGPGAARVTPPALRLTERSVGHWVEPAAPAPTAPAPGPSAPASGPIDATSARPPEPVDPPARTVRLLRGDALAEVVDGYRPLAHHYATHVLGLADAEPTGALVERALARAVGSYRGWRRLRRRPAGLGARLREAVRVEAWRHQRGRPRRRT